MGIIRPMNSEKLAKRRERVYRIPTTSLGEADTL